MRIKVAKFEKALMLQKALRLQKALGLNKRLCWKKGASQCHPIIKKILAKKLNSNAI